MYTLAVQTEEEYQQPTKIAKEEAVMLTLSQKNMRQLIKGLDRIQLYNKERRQIQRRKRGRLIDREDKDCNNNSSGAIYIHLFIGLNRCMLWQTCS